MLGLRVLGFWPSGYETYKLDPYTVYSVCMYLFVASHNIFQTVYIFQVYTDLEALAAIIFVLFTDWLDALKGYYFFRNMKLLKKLMIELENEQFQPKHLRQRQFLQPLFNSWKLAFYTFVFFAFFTLLLLVIFPILDGSFGDHRLPFFAWYPYNITISPMYEITYFYQVICIWFLASVCLNVDNFIAALMMYVGGQCDILCDNLRNLKQVNFNKNLISCIEHHKKIVRYVCVDVKMRVDLSNKIFQFCVRCKQVFQCYSSGAIFYEFGVVRTGNVSTDRGKFF